MLKKSQKNFLKISSFQLLVMFRRGLFYSFLSIYLRFYLKLSVTETTFFATFPMIVNILFQNVIWGKISDKYQKRRTLIIIGEIMAALGITLTWYLHTLQPNKHLSGYVIIAGLTIIEIFWSMSNLGWTALLSDLFEAKKLASIRGKMVSFGGFGRIIGVLIGGLAYDGLGHYFKGWGFQSGLLFFITSAIMIISSIPVFFLPEGGVKYDKETKNNKFDKVRDKSKLKLFTIFIVAMVFINFGRNSIAILKTQFFSLSDGLNLSPQIVSYLVNMQSIAMIAVGALIGKFIKLIKEEWILFFSAILAFTHIILFTTSNSIIVAFVANFFGGASQVLIVASSYAVASFLIPPIKRGRRFAIYNASLYLSWGIPASLITGPIADLLIKSNFSPLFAYRGAFWSAALINLVGIIVLTFFIKKYHICYQSKLFAK